MTSLHAWGRGDLGQLGLGGSLEDPNVAAPTYVKSVTSVLRNSRGEDDSIVQISAGGSHSAVVTEKGSVLVCGSNDFGQLGHEKSQSRFEAVDLLETYEIRSVSCGGAHTVAIDRWGKVFAWGSDDHGQCGHNTGSITCPVPKMVRGLGHHCVVQVSTGASHTLCLSNSGDLFAFGDNSHGQLGLGSKALGNVLTPRRIDFLKGLPIRAISCGAQHSVAVSWSGAVYAWGKNSYGQLGFGTNEDSSLPKEICSVRNLMVTHAACGSDHTALLTLDGGVFTFGAGNYGQLGHGGGKNNEQNPKKVLELMGTEVSQISCGNRHTLAFVPTRGTGRGRGRLYAFGLGGSGQLGSKKTTNASTPQVIHSAWEENVTMETDGQPNCDTRVTLICSGGDQSFCAVAPLSSSRAPPDFKAAFTNKETIKKLNTVLMDEITKVSRAHKDEPALNQDFLEEFETIFQSPACLCASFLTVNHMPCSHTNTGIDFAAWRNLFATIGESKRMSEIVANSVGTLLTNLHPVAPDYEALRIFLVLPLMLSSKFIADVTESDGVTGACDIHDKLHIPFAAGVAAMDKAQTSKFLAWLMNSDKKYIQKFVRAIKPAAIGCLRRVTRTSDSQSRASLKAVLYLLQLLNGVNEKRRNVIKYQEFYINELESLVNIKEAYMQLIFRPPGAGVPQDRFPILNYAFVFNAAAKAELLVADQILSMQKAVYQSQIPAMMFGIPPEQLGFFRLDIRRSHLVQDTLNAVCMATEQDLKKPMRVQFAGEEAEDAGGVTKEFFLLLMQDLLDPKYGMFKEFEENRTIWFNSFNFDDDISNHMLIGIFCGLAIYNFTIIHLPFPLILYKKLLSVQRDSNGDLTQVKFVATIDDLAELSPTVAKSMKQLLEYEDDDFEDIFPLRFVVSEECFGEARESPLKKGGDKISVTKENRKEYVNLYCDYFVNESIKRQFNKFQSGFRKVCNGRVMDLFKAEELMAMVVGNEDYDWGELEGSTQYKEGYAADHPTIVNFWSVFHNDLSLEDKKNFLLFLTGCDRVPVGGMKTLVLKIQRSAETAHLPVAHTCFNLLDLPDYSTKEKLRYMLLKAIQYTHGFGLA